MEHPAADPFSAKQEPLGSGEVRRFDIRLSPRVPRTPRPRGLIVTGLVRSKEGRPLPGVMLQLRGATEHLVTSDIEGRFRFTGIPPGKYELSFYARPRLEPPAWVTDPIEVQAGVTDIVLELERAPR